MAQITNLIFFVLAAICVHHAFGKPTSSRRVTAREALYNNNLHHGDMKLTSRQKAGLRNRVAINNLAARWPDGIVPYVIDSSLGEIENLIKDAAAHISERTDGCIKFVERTDEPGYLKMFKEQGCWSYVGILMPDQPQEQEMSLGDGCEFIGTIVHEMLHAIGFEHAQNRPDRDDYLNIYPENMQEGQESQFELVQDGLKYVDFDWDSIMLYGNYAFSKQPGVLKTMEDKTGEHDLMEPFDKQGLTDSDVYEIKQFYNC